MRATMLPGTSAVSGSNLAQDAPPSVEEKVALLRTCPPLRGMPELTLVALAWVAKLARWAASELLSRPDDPPRELIFVLEGLAVVTAGPPWRPGVPHIAWVRPGEDIGAAQLLAGMSRAPTITAATPVRGLRVSAARFHELLQTQPAFGAHLAAVQARRMIQLAQREAARARDTRLIVVLEAGDEALAALPEALKGAYEAARGGRALCTRLDALARGAGAGLEASERLHSALGRLQSEADLVVVQAEEAVDPELLRPVFERADLVLLPLGALTPERLRFVTGLAGPRAVGVQGVELREDPGPAARAALDRLGKPHEVVVYIPTTVDVNQEIDPTPYVERAVGLLGERFGGATVREARGVWRSEELGLVGERIIQVGAFCDEEALNEGLGDVTALMGQLKQELRQEAMAIQIDGRLVLV